MPKFYEASQSELLEARNDLQIEKNDYEPDDMRYWEIENELIEIKYQLEELEA